MAGFNNYFWTGERIATEITEVTEGRQEQSAESQSLGQQWVGKKSIRGLTLWRPDRSRCDGWPRIAAEESRGRIEREVEKCARGWWRF